MRKLRSELPGQLKPRWRLLRGRGSSVIDAVLRTWDVTKLRLIPALGATAAALILISSADAALFGGRPFVTTAFAETAEAEKQAFAVVQAGDARPYGCFLIRKGVVAGPRPG